MYFDLTSAGSGPCFRCLFGAFEWLLWNFGLAVDSVDMCLSRDVMFQCELGISVVSAKPKAP